ISLQSVNSSSRDFDPDSRGRVSDPLPPSAALPLTRGRLERSERGGRSHIILKLSNTPFGAWRISCRLSLSLFDCSGLTNDSASECRRLRGVLDNSGNLPIDSDNHGICPNDIRLCGRHILFTHTRERFFAFRNLFSGVC